MTVMNAASTGNIYKTIDQLIDFCRHRKKDCQGCPIERLEAGAYQ